VFRKYILFALILVLVPCLLFAGDTYNQTVSVKVGESYVMYYGTVDMSDDSTGNFYTQAMFLHDLNLGNGYLWAVCSNPNTGTEDVNVTCQYSMDRTTWLSDTALDGFDALGTTSVCDTVNVITGTNSTKFRTGRWIRILFDGQTGNTECTVSWWLILPKNEPFLGSKLDKSWYGIENKL
jgi:hypothetical protein